MSSQPNIRLCRRLVRFAEARRNFITDTTAMYIFATIVGIITGAGAFVLKTCIGAITKFLTASYQAAAPNWQFLVIPVAGILITGIFVRYILRIDITHGTSKLISALRHHIYRLSSKIIYGPIIGASITLGFGGSAGAEGPIAYVGGAVGSQIGHLARLSPNLMKIMVACGGGAGIAGIFQSPLGGFLFTLEVLKVELNTTAVMGVLTAAMAGGLTAYACAGFTPDIAFEGIHTFNSSLTLWYVVLGLACGVYSLYYSKIMASMQMVFDAISSPWLRNLSGGVILAAAIFFFPALYGEGYGIIAKMLAGDTQALYGGSLITGWSLGLMLGIIVLIKCFAVSASNSAGGVAGDFAPTLFAGCMVGLLFVTLINPALPSQLPVTDFAFLAMAGCMAGIVRAPFMAVFITVEMTGCYPMLLPVVIVAAMSFGVVRLAARTRFFRLS